MDWPSHLINVVGHKLASSCYALAAASLHWLRSSTTILCRDILDPTTSFSSFQIVSSAAVIMSKLKSQRIVISFYFPYLILKITMEIYHSKHNKLELYLHLKGSYRGPKDRVILSEFFLKRWIDEKKFKPTFLEFVSRKIVPVLFFQLCC